MYCAICQLWYNHWFFFLIFIWFHGAIVMKYDVRVVPGKQHNSTHKINIPPYNYTHRPCFKGDRTGGSLTHWSFKLHSWKTTQNSTHTQIKHPPYKKYTHGPCFKCDDKTVGSLYTLVVEITFLGNSTKQHAHKISIPPYKNIPTGHVLSVTTRLWAHYTHWSFTWHSPALN